MKTNLNPQLDIFTVPVIQFGCRASKNCELAKIHDDMQLKNSKMQEGSRREMIPHDEEGLTVRDIGTGNTYETVKAVTKQGTRKRWRISWNNKTGWRYFEDKSIKACLLRKRIESLSPEEQYKRNNIEAGMFQYCIHTRNKKARYRGLLKHCIYDYSRCLWENLRIMYIFQISTFKDRYLLFMSPLREAHCWLEMILTNQIRIPVVSYVSPGCQPMTIPNIRTYVKQPLFKKGSII